ncbi:hypothetical protein Tco_1576483 [Tanacetum coccineum]
MQKDSVSKQGRKPAKAKPTVHKDPAFDDLDDIVDDAMDYMESEDAQDNGTKLLGACREGTDERQIKEMNEQSKDPKKKRVVNETPWEEDTAKKKMIKVISGTINKNERFLDGDCIKLVEFAY